ncbi:hypothetical protein BpHYR1_020164 [Brachionus plicatilis]|uniref:Uncharacterized protein n=1 Tax=Brachionus plicatilis TaxID=10195 RepID=A0A3M7QQE8_BRAPC|nr:hypothetical protein BpHYR1_020164 [Brachionus plicatilis]
MNIGLKSLMARLVFCLLLALMMQLMCSVGVSHQSSSYESDINPVDDFNSRMRSMSLDQIKKNRLFPSDAFFKELIRVTNLKLKAHPNYQLLHKFLKDLKKKKYDTNFGEEDTDDYSYQGKFRF